MNSEKLGWELGYRMKILSMYYLKRFIFNLCYAIYGHKEAILSEQSGFLDHVTLVERLARESHPAENRLFQNRNINLEDNQTGW